MVRLRRLWLPRHPDRQPVLRQRRCQCRPAQDLRRVCRGLRLAPARRHRVRRAGRPPWAQAHPVADHPADGRFHHLDRPAADLRQHRPCRTRAADPGALPAGLFCRWRIRRRLCLPDGTCATEQASVLRQLRASLDLFRLCLCGGDRLWPGGQPVGRGHDSLGLAHPVPGGCTTGAGGAVPTLAHGRNPGVSRGCRPRQGT